MDNDGLFSVFARDLDMHSEAPEPEGIGDDNAILAIVSGVNNDESCTLVQVFYDAIDEKWYVMGLYSTRMIHAPKDARAHWEPFKSEIKADDILYWCFMPSVKDMFRALASDSEASR